MVESRPRRSDTEQEAAAEAQRERMLQDVKHERTGDYRVQGQRRSKRNKRLKNRANEG
jgi:hypothetical protein